MKILSTTKQAPLPPQPSTEEPAKKEGLDSKNLKSGRRLPPMVEKIVKNSKESLLQWYPPLMVYRNPEIQEVISTLFPPAGKALEIGRKLLEAAKSVWNQAMKKKTGGAR